MFIVAINESGKATRAHNGVSTLSEARDTARYEAMLLLERECDRVGLNKAFMTEDPKRMGYWIMIDGWPQSGITITEV